MLKRNFWKQIFKDKLSLTKVLANYVYFRQRIQNVYKNMRVVFA